MPIGSTRRQFIAGLAAAGLSRAVQAEGEPALKIFFDGAPSAASIRNSSDGNRVIALLNAAELEPLVSRFQFLIQSSEGEETDEFHQLSTSLYSKLWRPIESLAKDREVNLRARGMLRDFPFDTLKGPDCYVAARYRVRYLVGMRTSETRRSQQPFSAGRNFVYAPISAHLSVPELFWSRREVSILASRLPARVRRGLQATRAAFLSDTASPFSVLHVATHAMRNRGGEPSLALRMPPESKRDIDWLTASQISRLQMLGSRLAVLSACASARGPSGHTSLAEAFLKAGVAEVLGTRWTVDDLATLRFTQAFYDRLAVGNDAVAALRHAKASFIASDYKSFQSPHVWGPFVLLSSQVPARV
jgi:CHAT domain-containing protein